ncbi:MAG: bifunctional precorrin-2 dehydrogenase/sirohydrochlorin ferrochelatase [Lachnospiraceae bacterium]|uniref:Bifunctional precorrin-2 dehydrogenase/sirohydrochlorin ferrochelatase n=2 Tax=Hominisplanchenecus murintestinalis TaxID=2941517 RepID=A0AC61R0H0_9FIRM|nr:bifunctional precorrin-2 dehydrogenase/sirohydrochlorin ferrochelatase [Lachnospiraceae bacterium]RKJ95345.1 bifunctional precorrin-2 dehydrogenase/sirohydrochlorin ferrochelatase [Anaerotruncus sp. 1XD22-93]TGX98581.1 bifunctional precorrin-2 dehydrogenase/sirohydrochlorin ferrochelatase [Hominisplanchenecus murintestinalis]MCI9660985.1 bifunctional precorrin-2 dehydrogenase/sirohydrochlorin ferrochelatase [Lachnospiraceae bacterium]NBH97771.1 bifunctional precorrin-2 dehydrogenase/sirohydr
MFIDLTEKKVVVAGAGTIAKRRIRSLLNFTNHLTVIAPEVNKELKSLEAEGLLTILKRKCEMEDFYSADLVIAATNDAQINNAIYDTCRKQGILVNVCSDKQKCDFYFPGIAMKDQVVVGITASGKDHKRAKALVEQIRSIL